MVRTFKILLRKILKDIKDSWKLLISVIFIIGIAVTLYTGLEANASSFEKRVNTVFKKGNFADIWVTVSSYDEDDYKNILKFAEDDPVSPKKVEKRVFYPSSIGGFSANALISRFYPTINTSYDDEISDYFINAFESGEFFAIDEMFLEKYNEFNQKDIGLGDNIDVKFDLKTLKGPFREVALILLDQNFDDFINNLPPEIQNQVEDIIQLIKDNIDLILDEALDKKVNLEFKISNIMQHPENIQNGNLNTTNFLVGSKYMMMQTIKALIGKINVPNIPSINITSEQIDAYLNQIYYYLDSVSIYDEQLNFLDNIANQYVIKTQDVDGVTEKLNKYFESNDRKLLIQNRETYACSAVIFSDMIQSRQLTYCFPILFFAVALLVALTTIAQLLIKQRTQIGTMKALGLTTGQILLFYLGLFNAVSFIGFLIGIITGPLLIPNVMNIKYSILYSLTPMNYMFPILSISITLVILIAMISLLTFLLIKKELKLNPASSMRERTPNMSIKKVAKTIKHPSFMMALRNIRVHFAKSLMVIFGVMGCTGLLICGFGINDTINYGKNHDLQSYLESDFLLSYNIGTNEKPLQQLKNIKGVGQIEEFYLSPTNVIFNEQNVEAEIFTIDEKSVGTFFNFPCWSEEDNLCAVAMSLAERLNLKVGDKIKVQNSVETYELTIDKIFYTFTLNSVFTYDFVTPKYFEKANMAWANLDKGYKIEDVEKRILESNLCSTVSTKEKQVEKINGYMSSIHMMTGTVIVFAILLAVVVLINLGILNFMERKRDIATLKVIGFSRFDIAKALVYESIILTAIGSLLGLLIGLPLEMLVLSTNKTPLVYWIYMVEPLTYVIAIIISLVTSVVINLLMGYFINKVSMSESLKSVE